MNSETQVHDLNDRAGNLIAPEWFAKAEAVHRQLRPKLPQDYLGKMRRVFAGGGRMCIAVRAERVVGVAVYRIHENTAEGVQMYVDDLITDEQTRSSGVGKTLLLHLQSLARAAGCENFTLDSGTWRHQAHKFYFREGLVAQAFHFGMALESHS